LFFWIAPANCILSDINPELINFYQVLKDSSETLIPTLLRLRASKRLYYRLRSSKPSDPVSRAVRFAYLNRLCWNGLYRVNRLGQFNVPMGDRLPGQLWRRADLEQAAQALRRSKLLVGDFIETLKLSQQGDFVFLDPPYPRGSTEARDTREPLGFSRYSSTNFSVLDHERLGQAMRDLNTRPGLSGPLDLPEEGYRRSKIRAPALSMEKTPADLTHPLHASSLAVLLRHDSHLRVRSSPNGKDTPQCDTGPVALSLTARQSVSVRALFGLAISPT